VPPSGPVENARRRVEPPGTRQLGIDVGADRLVLSSVFPTLAHLADALVITAALASGMALLSFAAATGSGRFALDPRYAPLLAIGGLFPSVWGLFRLRALAPYRLTLTVDGIAAVAPRGVPLTADEVRMARPGRGGRRELPWAEVEHLELGRDGLVVHARARSLLVPWRYQRAVGMRIGVRDMTVSTPCFRFEELDWIASLAERLQSGDDGAIANLVGLRSGPAPTSVWEEPVFVLRGVGATRLRLLIVAVAGASAMVLATRWGLMT